MCGWAGTRGVPGAWGGGGVGVASPGWPPSLASARSHPTRPHPAPLTTAAAATSYASAAAAGAGLGEEQLPLSRLSGAAVVCLVGIGMPHTVEAHLRRMGAQHVEGCGAYEDHHMFTLEELQRATE